MTFLLSFPNNFGAINLNLLDTHWDILDDPWHSSRQSRWASPETIGPFWPSLVWLHPTSSTHFNQDVPDFIRLFQKSFVKFILTSSNHFSWDLPDSIKPLQMGSAQLLRALLNQGPDLFDFSRHKDPKTLIWAFFTKDSLIAIGRSS